MTELIIIILVAIAGYCNGEMGWINKFNLDSESWKNKWNWNSLANKGFSYTKSYHWWYFGLYKPKYQERFPYSSTILVFLTDPWHLLKWIMFTCYEASFIIIYCKFYELSLWIIPIGVVILKTVRGLGFTLKYDKK